MGLQAVRSHPPPTPHGYVSGNSICYAVNVVCPSIYYMNGWLHVPDNGVKKESCVIARVLFSGDAALTSGQPHVIDQPAGYPSAYGARGYV